jgi:hypothetical protein
MNLPPAGLGTSQQVPERKTLGKYDSNIRTCPSLEIINIDETAPPPQGNRRAVAGFGQGIAA